MDDDKIKVMLVQALRDLAVWATYQPRGRGTWQYVNACSAVAKAEGRDYSDIEGE